MTPGIGVISVQPFCFRKIVLIPHIIKRNDMPGQEISVIAAVNETGQRVGQSKAQFRRKDERYPTGIFPPG